MADDFLNFLNVPTKPAASLIGRARPVPHSAEDLVKERERLDKFRILAEVEPMDAEKRSCLHAVLDEQEADLAERAQGICDVAELEGIEL